MLPPFTGITLCYTTQPWFAGRSAAGNPGLRRIRGRFGFDAGTEAQGACREGIDSRKSIYATFLVANDENYALAA